MSAMMSIACKAQTVIQTKKQWTASMDSVKALAKKESIDSIMRFINLNFGVMDKVTLKALETYTSDLKTLQQKDVGLDTTIVKLTKSVSDIQGGYVTAATVKNLKDALDALILWKDDKQKIFNQLFK